MELHTYVDTTRVTFLVDDKASVSFQKQVLMSGAAWLKDARTRLTRALNYTVKAMVEPTKVASGYWDLLYMYFGLPRLDPASRPHLGALNTIAAKINQTSIGMNGDLTIADLSQMPGVAKAQLKCLNTINWMMGKDDISLAGLVFVDVAEAAMRYAKSFWKSSPSGVTMNPFAGPIHLNFEELGKRGDRSGIVTMIHEGTHKFVQTTDEQYFPEESAWDKLEQAIESCRPMIGMKYNTFEDLLVDARRIAMMGPLGEAVHNVETMEPAKALNNADGVANYAYEVAEFPTTEELEKALKALMRGK